MFPTFRRMLGASALLLLVAGGEDLCSQNTITPGERRELFVDAHMIDRLVGARLKLHRPLREGVALRFDLPWEGAFSGYVAVLNDSGLYRMYYRGLPGVSAPGTSAAVVCYAESRDGIVWTKPELGLYEVAGSRGNNVVLAEAYPFCSNFTPFLDMRPGVPLNERFKAVAGNDSTGLVAFVSADGIRWSRFREEPILRDGMFDSQNVVFWSNEHRKYYCYFRTWTGEGYTGFRTISMSTSKDFLSWIVPVAMMFGDTPSEHLYTNGTQPYFRAPHIFIALAKRFFPDKAALPPERAADLVENPRYRVASSDGVLMSSRGGNSYDRTFLEAIFRPGPDDRDWVSRDNTPALGMVPAGEREIYLYRMSHYAQPTAHVTRYSIRTDGFVSVFAPYSGGELVTVPFRFSGSALEINMETSAAGGIRVEVQDEDGVPVPGYSAESCREIFGDDVGRRVLWEGGGGVGQLAGRQLRLRFIMKDANLYSFVFR